MSNINAIMTTHFMLVSTHSSKPPQSRKLRKASAEVAATAGADVRCVSAVKELWTDCAEMDAVSSAINAASALHRKYTAPYTYDGPRLIKNTVLMDQYIPEMNEAVSVIEESAGRLLGVYDQRVGEQLAKLGGFGDVKDYPSSNEINNWNWFSYTFLPVPSVTDWERVEGVALGDYLAEQTAEATEAAARMAIQDSCKKIIKPIEALAQATSPQEEGKRARPVGANLVENIRHAASNIRQFNIFEDPTVEKMVGAIEQFLVGYTPDQIKNNESTKLQLNTAANKILDKMDSMGWG